MLSVDVNLIDGHLISGRERIAHVQITRRDDQGLPPSFHNYRWRIQNVDGSIAEGELNDFERSRGAVELLWQVLSLWMVGRENQQMADDFLRGLIEISVENPE